MHDAKDAVVQMAKLHNMFREDVGDGVEEEEMTRERLAEFWEQIQRVKTIYELERMLEGTAEEQAAAQGG